MKQVMFISESRKLLKQGCDILSNAPQYNVHVVSYSSEAFERFSDIKPDIVLLDMDTLMPYPTILHQFRRLDWPFGLVLLGGGQISPSPKSSQVYLCKERLTASLLLDALSECEKDTVHSRPASSDNGYPYTLFSRRLDYYDLLLLCLDAPGHPSEADLLSSLQSIYRNDFPVDLFRPQENLLVAAVGKHRISPELSSSAYDPLLEKALSPATLFLWKNVPWGETGSAIQKLLIWAPYRYFFGGQTILVEGTAPEVRPVSFEVLDDMIYSIAESLFSNAEKQIDTRIRRLFFQSLKPSLDLNAVYYVRKIFNEIFHLLSELASSSQVSAFVSCDTVESERDAFAQYCFSLAQQLRDTPILPAVQKGILYILKYYKQDISLETAADTLHLSKTYLSRAFKKQTGTQFVACVQHLRIQTAEFLLQRSNKKISAISFVVGYRDPRYFSRVFKKHMGFSPEEYRNHLHKNETEG